MPRIFIIDPSDDKRIELDFAALVTLIKGSSITSMAHSDKFFELGLSDAFNLRVQTDNAEADILLFSTLNKGELPPVRLNIMGDDKVPTAEALEKRIHSLLRQLYATAFLIDAGRSNDVAQALKQNPDTDLEASLLKEEDLHHGGKHWIILDYPPNKDKSGLLHPLSHRPIVL
jgi:hypothetical protein